MSVFILHVVLVTDSQVGLREDSWVCIHGPWGSSPETELLSRGVDTVY